MIFLNNIKIDLWKQNLNNSGFLQENITCFNKNYLCRIRL